MVCSLRGKPAAGKPASAPPITDLLHRAVVAKQFGFTEHTLRKWELGGRGPPTVRIGQRVYYRAAAVRRWLLDQERER
jgi:hypothetical protein